MSDAPELILYQEALARTRAALDAANARAEKAEREFRHLLDGSEELLVAARAENDRLLALIREWASKRERSGAVTMTYDLPLIAAAKEGK